MPDQEPRDDSPAYERPTARRPASAEGTLEKETGWHDPYAAFRFSAFSFYALGNLVSVIGRQMLVVAIEWEIYPPDTLGDGSRARGIDDRRSGGDSVAPRGPHCRPL